MLSDPLKGWLVAQTLIISSERMGKITWTRRYTESLGLK